jgi:hypothetical protein
MQPTGFVDRHWPKMLFVAWLVICVTFLFVKQQQIYWFALGDTDDNLRIMQVRAWLSGQDWYDLRQYRLDPPGGADIHWSRLVDLPIAALITVFKPFFGGADAEKYAVAFAPFFPMLVMLLSLGAAIRHLIGRVAMVEFLVMFLAMPVTLAQFAPLRIDHHGWQLASIALALAGIADPKRARGGMILGMATALSLVIGMEMFPYLVLAGGGTALRWVYDRREASRLMAYGVTLAAGTGLGYLAFVSYANQVPRCDALSPVWLSTMMATGGALSALTLIRVERWPARLVLLAIAGGVLAGGFALSWPQCLSRPDGASPELYKLWLSHVKEARPLYRQSTITIVAVGYAAFIGMVGAFYGMRFGRDREQTPAWAVILLMMAAAGIGLLWQTRTGAVTQLLAIIGGTAIMAAVVPQLRASNSVLIRVVGVVGALILISGIGFQHITSWATAEPDTAENPVRAGANTGTRPATDPKKEASKANAECSTIPSHAPIGRLTKATIFAPVDLNPRLIVLTHHNGIAGPYHRNEQAILDVYHAFRGSPDQARAIMARHGATLLLICPNSAEGTIFNAESPKGFYAQIEAGKTPDWLEPVALPASNPFRIWKIKPYSPR